LCGFSADLIKQFCSELSASNHPSVDAFLEQHKDNTDYENSGKAAIAACLVRFEDTPAIDNRGPNVRAHLRRRMPFARAPSSGASPCSAACLVFGRTALVL
jgi:hypothetical protein